MIQALAKTKWCRRCSRLWPATSDYFGKDYRNGGLTSPCRWCKHRSQKAWAQRNAEKLASQSRERYTASEKVRDQMRARVKRWKGENREHWLELKREQSKRRRERNRPIPPPPEAQAGEGKDAV